MRLAIATGCRADELAALPASAVKKDGSGFNIGNGKTENAIRYVPVVGAAQQILKERIDAHSSSGRLFPDWPLRPKIDKAYAVSQWFTRFRREVLGAETDGRLVLHSTRHTWRTVAHRAHVRDSDINQLGGWAKDKSTSSVYNHGLLEAQLRETQEQIWTLMDALGYLVHF